MQSVVGIVLQGLYHPYTPSEEIRFTLIFIDVIGLPSFITHIHMPSIDPSLLFQRVTCERTIQLLSIKSMEISEFQFNAIPTHSF